ERTSINLVKNYTKFLKARVLMNPVIKTINGPVVYAKNARSLKIKEMVSVGGLKLIGEVISVDGDIATIQVYEDTTGLKVGEEIISTSMPLSVRLGPGLLGNMFDGIERPLKDIMDKHGAFIPSGIGFDNLDLEKEWEVSIKFKSGDRIRKSDIYGTIKETEVIEHRLLSNVEGKVIEAKEDGKYKLEDTIIKVENDEGIFDLKLYQYWPVRNPRPVKK